MRAFLLSAALLIGITGVAAIAMGSIDMSARTVFSSGDTRH